MKPVVGVGIALFTVGNAINNWIVDHKNEIIAGAVLALAAVAIGASIILTGGMAGILFGLGAGALVGGMFGGISAHLNGTDIASGILGGAITGAALGAALPLAGFGAIGFAAMLGTTFTAGMASYAVETIGNNREFNTGHMLLSGLSTAIQGTVLFGLGSLIGAAKIMGPALLSFTKNLISRSVGNQLGFVTDITRSFSSGERLSKEEILLRYLRTWVY